ncbi:MAG TPA: NAD-dependent epimerase/dehydratase family protein [Nocardioides sp.]|nr:NAD-dependent epimerase/dehydratase family protein [Nocardioides sp.]
MRLLVLGGTVFLSRAIAEEAVRRGHEVTCACRGASGSVPEGATHVPWDRTEAVPSSLVDGVPFDAVVDVARHPSWVRSAVAAFPDPHWVFVSTISVYTDDSTPGGTVDTLPTHEPIHTDEDVMSGPHVYGAMKMGCEQAVTEGASSSVVVRPGLIVGPRDRSGRFSYWPARVADGGEILAPGSPDEAVQVIDVRDLAAWLVHCAEARTTGLFHGTGRVTSRAEFLDAIADGVGLDGPDRRWTWVDQDFLAAHDVEPWDGPRSLPVWLPQPDYAWLMSVDVEASYAAGLGTRPLADTARDTLAWLRSEPDAPVAGLDRTSETEVLEAWRNR